MCIARFPSVIRKDSRSSVNDNSVDAASSDMIGNRPFS